MSFINSKVKRPGISYLINLALVDLLKSTLNVPISVVSSFREKWIFSKSSKIIIYFCSCAFYINDKLPLTKAGSLPRPLVSDL